MKVADLMPASSPPLWSPSPGLNPHRAEEGGRLDARLLALALVHELGLEAAPLGPPHLHAQEHLGPVLGVGATRAGVDRDHGVARVVGAAEEPFLLELVEPGLHGRARLLALR